MEASDLIKDFKDFKDFFTGPTAEFREEPFYKLWDTWTTEDVAQMCNWLNTTDDAQKMIDTDVAPIEHVKMAAKKVHDSIMQITGGRSCVTNDLEGNASIFTYRGVPIRFPTIYDRLGYILSAVGSLPIGLESDAIRNHYLPLLSLYMKWCNMLAEDYMEAGQQTQHITYFPANAKNFPVLLGSTIGHTSLVALVKAARIGDLNAVNLNQPHNDGKEGHSRFGLCAETAFFIYCKRTQVPITGVRGFAINSGDNAWKDIKQKGKYNESYMRLLLRDPCETCQDLMEQVGINWRVCFDVKDMK